MPDTCYACDQLATTREHAPPKSFFPADKRDQLITVPSCEVHNNDNSPDVDYVRNLLSFQFGTNQDGLSQFNGVVQRSLARSTGLKVSMLSSMATVQVDETLTGQVTVDRCRVDRIMKAIVQALHFRDTSQKVREWTIIDEFLDGTDQSGTDVGTQRRILGATLDRTSAPVQQITTNPTVFSYASCSVNTHRFGTFYVYTLQFYERAMVKAFSIGMSELLNLANATRSTEV